MDCKRYQPIGDGFADLGQKKEGEFLDQIKKWYLYV
jgi:hypothetical protein